MSISTFTYTADARSSATFSIRPGWITRLAILGKLAGEEHLLIGVTPDFGAEMGEHGIAYGVLTDSERAAVESALAAPLTKLMDNGVTVQARSRTSPGPTRLVALTSPPVDSQVGHIEVWPTSPPERLEAVAAQQRGREQFTAQRDAALKLRKSWNVGEMRHRSDFPAWLPSWVRECITESSRAWLELPNAPAGFVAPTLPPLPNPNWSSKHPTMPQCAR